MFSRDDDPGVEARIVGSPDEECFIPARSGDSTLGWREGPLVGLDRRTCVGWEGLTVPSLQFLAVSFLLCSSGWSGVLDAKSRAVNSFACGGGSRTTSV